MNLPTLLTLSLGTYVASASEHISWSYEGSTGPDQWPFLKLGPQNQCGLSAQSPIDIDVMKAKFDSNLRPLRFKHSDSILSNITVVNTGHSIQLNSPDWSQILMGGPLKSSYKLLQIHCHWGKDDYRGSEHTFNGKRFPIECHLVHKLVPDPKYPSSNAIAVVATFFEATKGESNIGIKKFAQSIPKNMKTHEALNMEDKFSPSMLLPNIKDFYTYEGSLTTPPCSQNVTWIVLRNFLNVSDSEMNRFRSTLFEDDRQMVDNFRPTQPVNNRDVKASFVTGSTSSLLSSSLPLMMLSTLLCKF